MRRGSTALLIGLLCLARPLPADEVELKSGGRLSCEVVAETETYVEVRLPHGKMRIPKEKIARIHREKTGDYLKREAESSLKGGSTAGAVDLYERAFLDRPEDPATRDGLARALMAHARALTGKHRLDEALSVLRRLAEIDPSRPGAIELLESIHSRAREESLLHKRGLQALRDGQFATALRYLDAWRLRRPVGDADAKTEMAAAHLMAARARLEKGDLRGALDNYRSAKAFGERDRTGEALHVLRPIAVLEALKDGESREAERLLDTIETTYPDPVVPLFLQAVLHHMRGEVREAVATYAEVQRAKERRRPNHRGLSYELVRDHALVTLRAAIARPPAEGQAKWREIFLEPLRRHDRGDHFTVFAPTADQAGELAEAADEVYEETAREILGGVPSAGRAELVVHPSRQAYVAADPAPPGSPLAGITLPRQGTGGVTYDTLDENGKPVTRIEIFLGVGGVEEDVLPHEIVHLVQRRGLAVFRRGHWLDEGLAMLHESASGQEERRKRLQQLGDPMPLAVLLALRSTPPDKAELFYQQSYSLTRFLHDRGTESDWRRFLGLFARKDLERALDEVYRFDSIDELEREWRASLGD